MEMTKEIARRIGSREAFIASGIALAIDVIIILFVWFRNGLPQNSPDIQFVILPIVFGIALLLFGQLFGRISGSAILVKKLPYALVGSLCAVATLACATSTTGLTAFLFFHDWSSDANETLEILGGYVFGSAFVTVLYSAVVLIPHGIIFGYRIYRNGQKLGR